jgi:glutaredoxin 3
LIRKKKSLPKNLFNSQNIVVSLKLSCKVTILNILLKLMIANVEIYTWTYCPFCIRAKALLDKKGVAYQEYNIDGDEAARDKMAQRANGKRSLPQIFINDSHIGGCDDIHALETEGKLDRLLQV